MSTTSENKKVTNSSGYLGTLDPQVEKYLYGLAPRLVQSIKSSRIYDDSSLTEWLLDYFEIFEFQKRQGIRIQTSCYGLLVHLLTKMSNGKYPQNALIQYVELLLPQVRSWLLATLNAGAFSNRPTVSCLEQKLFFVKYFQLGLESKGEKVLKYHLNYIFSRATRQPDLEKFVLREKPPQEKGLDGFLFGGTYRTWIARKLFCKKGLNQKRMMLAFTLAQSKRAWEPISTFLVRDSLLKHAKALGNKKTKEEFVIRDEKFPFSELQRQISRTVDELFPRKRFTKRVINVDGSKEQVRSWSLPHNVPSLSACQQCSRSDGGSLNHFSEELIGSKGVRNHKKFEKGVRVPASLEEVQEDRCYVDLTLILGSKHSELVGFLEINGEPVEIRGFIRHEHMEKVNSLRRHLLTRAFECLFGCRPDGFYREDSENFTFEEQFVSDVHVVLEPAKARIITAGPAGAYHLSRSIQKIVHSHLRQHPTFRLIGEPLTVEVMNDFSKRLKVTRDSWFMSADYSQATDNLHSSLIKACARRLADNIGLKPFEREIYLRSLLDHHIVYPIQKHPYGCRLELENPGRIQKELLRKGEVEYDFYEPSKALGLPKELDINSFDQESGQLMGSPSSFPILCIINAAVNRFFFEQTIGQGDLERNFLNGFKDELLLKDVPMLVNGDDLLMTLDPKDYDDWWRMVSTCGLEPSLGKNYISKDFAMLNTQIYLQGRDSFGCHAYWERVPYVNLGLLRGQSKVLGDTRRAERDEILSSDLVSAADFLLEGFQGDLREHLLSLWIHLNLDKIKSVTFEGQNWFIPQQLGGLGLPLPREEVKVTRGQGKLAKFFATSKELVSVPNLGAPKPTYLRMEKIVTGGLNDLVEWEWVEEREGRAQLPNFAKFFEIWCGEEVELHPKEKAYDRELSRRHWDVLWTRGTDHSMDQMTDKEIRHWGRRYQAPTERTKITSTVLASTLFRHIEGDLSIASIDEDVELPDDPIDLMSSGDFQERSIDLRASQENIPVREEFLCYAQTAKLSCGEILVGA